MKIAVDYHLVTRNPNSGMGVYVKEVVEGLRTINNGNTYYLFDKSFPGSSLIAKLVAQLKEQFWIQLTVSKSLSKDNFDLAYFPNPPLAFFSSVPAVLTIPDMSFYHDKTISILVKVYLYLLYYLSAHKAKRITTFSANSKSDIVKILFVDKRKIAVVPPGLKDVFTGSKVKTTVPKTLHKYAISTPYILSVPGTFVARKNMSDLVYAFKKLPKSYLKNLSLVLVGNTSDSYFKQFEQSIDGVANILCPGKVADSELRDLYSNALMFVYPSLYEGFGLPPLEAMACRTPVIVYNNSSLPEVVGDSAILVSNREQLLHAMLGIITSKTNTSELISSGVTRAKKFSWHNTTKALNNEFVSVGL